MFAVAVYTAPIGSHSSLLAWVRGSVIRQALASCGAPGSSNITPLSKLNTGLWRHCIVVQDRAEQGSCLQKKDRKSYGLAYRKIPALLCRLLLRDTGRTPICFSDIPSSSKMYKNIQATLHFLNIIALKNSCLHANAFLQQFCSVINFTWRYQTSNETFHSFIQCLLWNTFCLHRKRVKLLEMTDKTNDKQMQLGKQCMDSNQWQICSSASLSNIYEHVIFIKESKDYCHYLLKLLFCFGGGAKNTLTILYEGLFHMATSVKIQNTKNHHKKAH